MTLLPGVSLKAQPNAAAEQMGAGNPIIALSVSEKCAHLPSGQNAERSLRMKSSPQLIIHIWIKNIKNFIISRDCRQRLWLVFTNYQTLAVWIFLLKGWREEGGRNENGLDMEPPLQFMLYVIKPNIKKPWRKIQALMMTDEIHLNISVDFFFF